MFTEDETSIELKAEQYIERIGSSLLTETDPRYLETQRKIWTAARDDAKKAKILAAQMVFSVMCKDLDILPLILLTDKRKTSSGFQKPTRKGGSQIDQAGLATLIVAQYVVFLERHHARGAVVLDDKGAENPAMKTAWLKARAEVKSPQILDEEVDFPDSKLSAEVQAADVFLGLLRFAYEADDVIAPGFQRLMTRADEQLLLMQLE